MAIKRIKIEESEQKAKELLCAIGRLEQKFPQLRGMKSGVSAVRQRFEAISKPVMPGKLDRRGSLIGGVPFLCEDYPGLDMAPLLQLDLDAVSAVAGESVGSGLLQAWMPFGLWGQQPCLGDLHTRVIPRDVVDDTPVLMQAANSEDAEWYATKAAEIEVLKIVDPIRAEENEEIYQEHYWSGVDGVDWTLSRFSDYENWNSLGRFGAPRQIVEWQPAGYAIPPTGNYGIWDSDEEEFEGRFPRLFDDPDYEVICGIVGVSQEHPICALFDVYSDFDVIVYGNEYCCGDDAGGWRPLFAFPGPLSDCLDDQHVIFYRAAGNDFEYIGTCMRWDWH